jgi:hypothetical protein
LAIIPAIAFATPITYSASSDGRAATATFSVVGGNQLQVVLTNTGGDALVPVDVLTAVYFSTSAGTLTPVSALLTAGSTVLFDTPPAGGNVGGEWAYTAGIAAPGGATRGISSTGLGLFGAGDSFPGSDLDPPAAPNGLNYGIVSAADNPLTGNSPMTGGEPLIQSSVTFLLSGLVAGFDPFAAGAITNVSFQYGTGLSDPRITGCAGVSGCETITSAPEPASMILLGTGLLACASRLRRRAHR